MSDRSFTFQPEYDGSLPIENAVYQAIGAASVCWENMENTGIFQDDLARTIAEALLVRIREELAR